MFFTRDSGCNLATGGRVVDEGRAASARDGRVVGGPQSHRTGDGRRRSRKEPRSFQLSFPAKATANMNGT